MISVNYFLNNYVNRIFLPVKEFIEVIFDGSLLDHKLLHIILEEMNEKDEGILEEAPSFGNLCLQWFQMSRRARKELHWHLMYFKMAQLLFPDLDLLQLMIPEEAFQ